MVRLLAENTVEVPILELQKQKLAAGGAAAAEEGAVAAVPIQDVDAGTLITLMTGHPN